MSKNGQSFGSWLTSMIAIGMGLAGFLDATGKALAGPRGSKWGIWRSQMLANYLGVITKVDGTFQTIDPMRAWGGMSLVGGIVVKKLSSTLIRTAPIKSIFPRL